MSSAGGHAITTDDHLDCLDAALIALAVCLHDHGPACVCGPCTALAQSQALLPRLGDVLAIITAWSRGEAEEPILPEDLAYLLDVVLVPGVAFDLGGRRLGRGAGYYDRLLTGVRGTTCGVAFDEQISGELPVEPHDVHVNCILTPTRWLSC